MHLLSKSKKSELDNIASGPSYSGTGDHTNFIGNKHDYSQNQAIKSPRRVSNTREVGRRVMQNQT